MSNNNNDEEKLDKNLEKPQEEEEEDDKLILNSEIKDSDNDAGPAAIMGDDASEGEVAASQGEVAASRSDNSEKEEEEKDDDDQDALDQQKFLQWVRNRFGECSKSNLRFGECSKCHLRLSECCKEILIEILTSSPICKFFPCYSSLNPLIDPCLDPCSCSGH